MEPAEKNIIQTLGQNWEKGLVLSPTTLSFLDSSFGMATATALGEALSDQEFPEREMILEMILFPEPDLRLALEPLLGPGGLGQKAEAEITRRLIHDHPVLRLIHPDQEAPLEVCVPPDQAATFVSRLFLTRTLDPEICEALEKCAAPMEALSFRILLRTLNNDFKKEKIRFMLRFIQSSRNLSSIFTQVFELFVRILGEAPDSGNYEDWFVQRREQEKNRLRSILRFEEKRDRYPMEYLMLSRYPIPHESLEVVSQRMEKLDLILNQILGVPPRPILQPVIRDLGTVNPKESLDRLFDILS